VHSAVASFGLGSLALQLGPMLLFLIRSTLVDRARALGSATTMAEIEGQYDERFAGVAGVLSRSLDEGSDVGASVAVLLDGEPMVDIWGGYKDLARTEP
jgi:hypothetical protein